VQLISAVIRPVRVDAVCAALQSFGTREFGADAH